MEKTKGTGRDISTLAQRTTGTPRSNEERQKNIQQSKGNDGMEDTGKAVFETQTLPSPAEFSDRRQSSNVGARPKMNQGNEKGTLTNEKYAHTVPENIPEKGHTIGLNIEFTGKDGLQNTPVRHSCTVDEYMKWQFILCRSYHLDALNKMIREKYDAEMNSNGVLKVNKMLTDEAVLSTSHKVLNIVLELEEITVTHIPVQLDMVEHFSKQINDSAGMNVTCQTEVINNDIFIAYLSKNSHKVNEYLKDQCGITMQRFEKKVNKVIILKPMWEKLYKMINLGKALTEAVADQGFDVNIERDLNGLRCVLSGTQKSIDLASVELSQLEENVCCERCNLMITNVRAVAELSVISYLEDILANKNLKCCVSQKREQIFVHGFSQQLVMKVCKLIESTIIEKPIIVKEAHRDNIEHHRSIAMKNHQGCIVFHIESNQKLFVIGVKKFVEDFVHSITTPSTGHGASKEKYLIKVKVPDENVREFIESSIDVGKFFCTNDLTFEFVKEEDSTVVMVKGEQSALDNAGKFLVKLMKNFSMKTDTVDDVKGIQYLLQDVGRQSVQACVTNNDVLLKLHTDHSGSSIEDISWFPDNECERQCSWSDTQNTRCVRLIGGKQMEDNNSYCIEFKSVSKSEGTIRKSAGNGLIVNVPMWKGGKDTAVFSKFDSILKNALEIAEQRDQYEIVILLHHACDWPFDNYIHRITRSVVKWLTSANHQSTLRTIVLLGNDDHEYNSTKSMVDHAFHHKYVKDNEKELKVMVVPGELSTIKADVLVNTTGKDLDLSVGKVSNSLLKAAGKALQNECNEKYPDGITNSEIAVTDGYKLHSHKVFHITLDRYMQTNDMDSIQTIRYLVEQCLVMTSRLGLHTIAFPAIGTGILQYPVDIVSAGMFESVEKFKVNNPRTSIESIMFVIYPKNEKVLAVFQANEKILYKSESLKYEIQKGQSTFTVMGLQGNVNATMKQMHEVIQRAKIDPNEVVEKVVEGFTRMIYTIWSKFYSKHDSSKFDIELNHDVNCAVLRLKGKRNVVEPLCETIITQLKDINSSHMKQLRLPGINRECVLSALAATRSKHGEHFCMSVFDLYVRMIYLCGQVERVIAFERDLELELRKVSGYNEDEFDTKSDEKKGNLGDKILAEASKKDEKEKAKSCRSPVRDQQMHLMKQKDKTTFQGIHPDGDILKSHDATNTDKRKSDKSMDGVPEAVEVTEDTPRVERGEMDVRPSLAQLGGGCVKAFRIGQSVVFVYQGDILKVKVQCIVNPANCSLTHEGGLAAIIAKAAGKKMVKESKDIFKAKGQKPLPVTTVVLTGAGHLPYMSIMHAVGPCWFNYQLEGKPQCAMDLCNTVVTCLLEAENNSYETIALPMISSGIFGVPVEVCAAQYIMALDKFSQMTRNILQEIHFLDIHKDMVEMVQKEFSKQFSEVTPDNLSDNDVGGQIKSSNARQPIRPGSVSRLLSTGHSVNKVKDDENESAVNDADLRKTMENKLRKKRSQSPVRDQQMHLVKQKSFQGIHPDGDIPKSHDATNTDKRKGDKSVDGVPEAVEVTEDTPRVEREEIDVRPSLVQLGDGCVKAFRIGQSVVFVYQGDILKVKVQCIVNPANRSLTHQGGLAAIIAKAAGKDMIKESKDIFKANGKKPLPVTTVVLTGAGRLPYMSIMHAVGPCWFDYQLEGKPLCATDLCTTVVKCLLEAENNSYDTIALPMISSGMFGVPLEVCAAQYRMALETFSQRTRNTLKEIHFLDIRKHMVEIVQDVFSKRFSELTPDNLSGDFVDGQIKSSDARQPTRPGNVSRLSTTRHSDTTIKDDENESVVHDADLRKTLENMSSKKEALTWDSAADHPYREPEKQLKNTTQSEPRHLKVEDSYIQLKSSKGKSRNEETLIDNCTVDDRQSTPEKQFKNTTQSKPNASQNGASLIHANPSKEKRFTCFNVSCSLIVNVYNENKGVLQDTESVAEGIDCVVCCVNQSGEAADKLSKVLASQYGEQYLQELSRHFQHGRNVCDVVATRSSGSKNKFILHAVIPCRDEGQLRTLYKNVLDNAAQYGMRSLTMSLLCCDTGHLEPKESADALHNACSEFAKKHGGHKLSVHLVSHDLDIHEAALKVFSAKCHQVQSHLAADRNDLDNASIMSAYQDSSEDCVICMDKITEKKELKCGHSFCTDCIDGYFRVKKICPTCGEVYGIVTGNQPTGTMEIEKLCRSVAGYEQVETLSVIYIFPPGHQSADHPSPGTYYKGISRTAYLPDTVEGREICSMLKIAFERRLVFTIGTSRTTGQQGVITWNDIHHKTELRPNTPFGYPDETYLERVRDELAAKGVCEPDMSVLKDLKKSSCKLKFSVTQSTHSE